MSQIIEGKPVLAPAVCFICELSNPVRYIDTFRDFYGIVKESLDGRKYLCEQCVEDAATKLGFVTPKTFAELQDEAHEAFKRVEALEADLKKFEDLKAIVDHFGKAEVKVTPKKVAAKKAA